MNSEKAFSRYNGDIEMSSNSASIQGKASTVSRKSRKIDGFLHSRKLRMAIDVVERIEAERRSRDPDSGWENLPWLIQYYPLIIKYFSHLGKVAALNPGMGGIGGLIGASKISILKNLHSSSYAATIFIRHGIREKALRNQVTEKFGEFPGQPLICKPDRGERSINVKKISSFDELFVYLHEAKEDFLIQEYIPGPEELGVSCFRNLADGRLEVAAVVRRILVKGLGDGISTLGELIEAADIPESRKDRIRQSYMPKQLAVVPPADRLVMLSPVAALSFGTVIEEVHREDYPEGFARLEEHINEICINDAGVPFEGFNYGRFDYRAESLDALFAGRGKILELNGAAAMALHACVPGLQAEERYAIFIDFFDRMLEICRANRRSGKGRYLPLIFLYFKSRKRLHHTSVQWAEVSAALKEIRKMRKQLKREKRN